MNNSNWGWWESPEGELVIARIVVEDHIVMPNKAVAKKDWYVVWMVEAPEGPYTYQTLIKKDMFEATHTPVVQSDRMPPCEGSDTGSTPVGRTKSKKKEKHKNQLNLFS